MPPCTLGVTLRNTSDICIRNNRLKFGFALRIIDHHVHASGILPHVSVNQNKEQNSPFQIYDHNWFCISQSITTPTAEKLKYLALQDKTDTAQIHTWISTIGKSSLHLASSINATHDNNTCLALAKRVFVRRSPKDVTVAAPFTEEESQRFARFMYDNNMQILPDLLDTPQTTNHKTSEPVLCMPIGPQHFNLGNHVDHAFLAETAAHALWKAGVSEEQNDTLKIQYLAEGTLGKSLECYVPQVSDKTVYLYQDERLVAVAEQARSQDKKLHSRHY